MRIVFVSNYLNHHQLPLCNALRQMEKVAFRFVAVDPISQARLDLGYSDMDNIYDFVIRAYLDKNEEKKAIQEMRKADVIISGVELRNYLKKKDLMNKLIFLYLERNFPNKGLNLEFIINILKAVKNHTLNGHKNFYILCAGGYVAPEFKKLQAYKGRMYKWGYFPEVLKYEKEKVLNQKGVGCVRLLWAGRFLKWKRPQQALEVAKVLKAKGYEFVLDMIGNGEQEEIIRRQVCAEQLEMHVNLRGSIPPGEVRKYMDCANIFLFTSNAEEGWGAVLNEAMNSRCAVVANYQIGSVPFLIENGHNGLTYNGTVEDLIEKTECLVRDKKRQLELGEQAYQTIITYWNADVAAENLIRLSKRLQTGKGFDEITEGPCSYIG